MAYLLGSGRKNALINGNFDVWQWGVGPISAPVAINTFLADRWYVTPNGAAVSIQQTAGGTAPNTDSYYSLGITGAVGATSVQVSQRIESVMIRNYRPKMTCTLSMWIYNGTGLDFAPTLSVRVPTAQDDYTSATTVFTVPLKNCPNATWTKVTWSWNVSNAINSVYGLELNLSFPDGSLDSNAKSVYVAQAQFERGAFPTEFERYDPAAELVACQRYFEKSYSYAQTPGAGTVLGMIQSVPYSTSEAPGLQYKVTKRVPGTVTLFSYLTGASGRVLNTATVTDVAASAGYLSDSGIGYLGSAALFTTGARVVFHYTVSAEL